jgi:hypothetical protein
MGRLAARLRGEALAGLLSLRWLVAVPLLRMRARRRVAALTPGAVTVVTVNWSSWSYLEVLLRAVRRHSPADVRILVVDNGSKGESRRQLALRPDVRTVRLPMNLGHDFGLDVGFLLTETEYVVALDVDAFPIDDGWLDGLLAPLAAGKELSGGRHRDFVHPSCLAMRTARFVEAGHSFRSRWKPPTDEAEESGDVGEDMSDAERGNLHLIEATARRGPHVVGTVFGGLVYHNFYSTRFGAETASSLDGGVTSDEAASAWAEALARYGL